MEWCNGNNPIVNSDIAIMSLNYSNKMITLIYNVSLHIMPVDGYPLDLNKVVHINKSVEHSLMQLNLQ